MTARAISHAVEMHLMHSYGTVKRRDASSRNLTATDKRSIADYIRSNLDSEQNVQRLAEICGFPTRRFTTAFRAAFGTSPWQYVLDARLEEAARLLRSCDEPITTVALTVGFSTPSHFAASFARKFGVAPSRYRSLAR